MKQPEASQASIRAQTTGQLLKLATQASSISSPRSLLCSESGPHCSLELPPTDRKAPSDPDFSAPAPPAPPLGPGKHGLLGFLSPETPSQPLPCSLSSAQSLMAFPSLSYHTLLTGSLHTTERVSATTPNPAWLTTPLWAAPCPLCLQSAQARAETPVHPDAQTPHPGTILNSSPTLPPLIFPGDEIKFRAALKRKETQRSQRQNMQKGEKKMRGKVKG